MQPVIIKKIDGVTVGYAGKAIGNTVERYGGDAAGNFAKFLAKFPGKTAYNMLPEGADKIVEVDRIKPEQLDGMEVDGLITTKPENLLTLKAADCIPVVFYVPGEPILALAHVGTPGAALHLPQKMVQKLGLDPAKLKCYFGPSITQKSYYFPADQFQKQLGSEWDKYISKKAGWIYLDLQGFVRDELIGCGVKPENIRIEDVDTGADPDYFSHRRSQLTGQADGRNSFGVYLEA